MKKNTFSKLKSKTLLLTILLSFSACVTAELNQISTKKIKNDTGQVEEYRTIKISQDDENDYFLNIKIFNDMKPETTQFGDLLTVYRFSIGEANQYSNEGVFIFNTKDNAAKIESYVPYYDGTKTSANADLKEIKCGSEKIGNFNVKSCLIKHINPCCIEEKSGSIKFAGQKEIYITKFIQGVSSIWSIEYGSKVNPFGAESVKDKFNKGLDYINNCCQVVAIKKTKLTQ